MAVTPPVHQHIPPPASYLLGVWGQNSWSSELPSRRESLRLSPLSRQTPGSVFFSKLGFSIGTLTFLPPFDVASTWVSARLLKLTRPLIARPFWFTRRLLPALSSTSSSAIGISALSRRPSSKQPLAHSSHPHYPSLRGRVPLFAFPHRMNLRLILVSPLAFPRAAALTVTWQMLEQILYAHAASAHSQNGSTIIASYASCASTWRGTTHGAGNGIPASWQQGVATTMAGAFGLVALNFLLTSWRSSTRTWPFPSLIYQVHPPAPPRTPNILIILLTLIEFRRRWAFRGLWTRTSCSPMNSRSRASSGILPKTPSPWDRQRRQSIFSQYRHGPYRPLTRLRTCRSFMGSFGMRARLLKRAVLISPASKPCFASSTIVLSCRVPLPTQLQLTSPGGLEHSSVRSFPVPSRGPWISSNPELTPTPAPGSVSELLSGNFGGLGLSFPAGNLMSATSVGPKPWALSSLSAPSLPWELSESTPKYSGTMTASSKGGGIIAAAIVRSTSSSAASISFSNPTNAPSTPDTLLVPPTLLTVLRVENFPRIPSFCPDFPSLSNSNHSSPISITGRSSETRGSMCPILPAALSLSPQTPRSREWQLASPTSGTSGTITNYRMGAALPSFPRSARRPRPYPAHLPLRPSPLRPLCLARNRLRLWTPLFAREAIDNQGVVLAIDLQRLQDVMAFAWAPGTLEVYGSGLLVYHVFCDMKGIPESQRSPASSLLISSFIATLAGSYSGSTLANYYYGVRAWHVLHSISWSVEQVAIDALLKAATTLAPHSSKRKKRLPYTVEILLIIRSHLDLSNPFDAAVWACLTTVFYSVARVGEFTVRTLTSFDPAIHVTRSNMKRVSDRNGLEQTAFFIPQTKSAQVHSHTRVARGT
ncbi:hypothetical protein DFH06DRAFT_148539 [Mycena polygramma]|nr:hypothetical protein DFH06DRAFT_148539 [Mycena polygramma]